MTACYHCGLPVLAPGRHRLFLLGAERELCCAGCEAVAATITVLEDAPQFNAGRGAVFTHDGRNELDTSIMDGATGKAGAAAGLHRVRNPILLARAIMERSKHVMMVGDGAPQIDKWELRSSATPSPPTDVPPLSTRSSSSVRRASSAVVSRHHDAAGARRQAPGADERMRPRPEIRPRRAVPPTTR